MQAVDVLRDKHVTINTDNIVTTRDYTKRYVLSIPHAGTLIPTALQDTYDLGNLALQDTDLFTDELFHTQDGVHVITALNRYVLNVNRQRSHDGTVAGYSDEDALRTFLMDMEPAWDDDVDADHLLEYFDTYHELLTNALHSVKDEHGSALLVACHSMNATSGTNTPDSGERPGIALGDRYGKTTSERVMAAMEDKLRGSHFTVERNEPYSGGYTIDEHSEMDDVDAVQIEVNKKLYMDEDSMTKHDGFDDVRERLARAIEAAADEVHAT